MTTGLDGKVMSYDGENRPVSVSFAGRTTAYVYGADGARLKKVETDPVAGATVTLYMGPVEIRRYGQGAAEEILLYPRPDIRITKTMSGSTVTTRVNALHTDGLGSVRAVTDGAGTVVEHTTYLPFGEEAKSLLRVGPEDQPFVAGGDAEDVRGTLDVEGHTGGHDDLVRLGREAIFAGGLGGADDRHLEAVHRVVRLHAMDAPGQAKPPYRGDERGQRDDRHRGAFARDKARRRARLAEAADRADVGTVCRLALRDASITSR